MKINTAKNGIVLKVSVAGRLDTTTSPEFEDAIKSEIGDITELIIDFSNLDYISSAGLRVLLSLQKMMIHQGSMKITGVNETVNEIFEVTGFSDILTIE